MGAIRNRSLATANSCLAIIISVAMLASAPASAADPVAKLSLQQQFNQATSAFENGDCTTALPIFETLAADPHVKPGSIVAGAIAVRRGSCLFALRRFEESEPYLEIGLPIMRAAGSQFDSDVADADRKLGMLAKQRWDHDDALRYLTDDLALRHGEERITSLLLLAQLTAFDSDQRSLDYVGEAERLETSVQKPDKNILAAIHTVRGRVFMNRSENKAALAELKQALNLSGGLTSYATIPQAAMRGDLAQAELLNGDKDQARLYLAYTGAGRIPQSSFTAGAAMGPPQCGPETGLKPEDSAIVEFSIGDDGDVEQAQTVYTRGNFAVAAAFARAVNQWYWRPEELAKLPAFYRVLTRVELRCSNSGSNLPSIESPLLDRFTAWAGPLLAGVDIENAKVGLGLEILAKLARQREAEGAAPAMVAALALRATLDPRPNLADVEALNKALVAAETAKLPPEVISSIYVFRRSFEYPNFIRNQIKASHGRVAIAPDVAAVAEQALRNDALAQDTLALRSALSDATPAASKQPLFTGIADDARLPDHHPLRQVALLNLANAAARDHDLARAQTYFKRTGLTEEQCALIGVSPSIKGSAGSSSDYPMEALLMGFEGWVKLEFDIEADGRTARIRPVIAYPPFVFVDGATKVVDHARFEASYRPTGSAACTAHQRTVNFVNRNS